VLSRLRRRLGRLHLGTPLALAACLVGYYAVPYGKHGWSVHGYTGVLVFAVAAVMLAAVLIRQVAGQLLDGGENTLETLIIALFLLVIAFALVYIRIADEFTEMTTKTDSLYFTMTTLATVGYGDIHPVTQNARAIVTVQMGLDLVYVATAATIVTRLVRDKAISRHAARSHRDLQ
jgi:voltage-gated potassium channel